METWIVYRLNPYGSPKIQQIEVQAYDINSAVIGCGFSSGEIVCVKLKIITECTTGL